MSGKPKVEDHGSFKFIDRRGVNKKETKEKLWRENYAEKWSDQELTEKALAVLEDA